MASLCQHLERRAQELNAPFHYYYHPLKVKSPHNRSKNTAHICCRSPSTNFMLAEDSTMLVTADLKSP